MAKKIVEKEPEFDLAITEDRPPLENTAFSVIKTGKKLYAVVSIKFNPETKETGEYTVLTGDVDFYEAQHQFRTLVIKSGILS